VHPFRAAREHAKLLAFHDRAERLLALPPAELFEPATAVSAWSVGAHLFHVSLSNELVLRNVVGIVDGKSPLLKPYEASDERGAAVLRRGRIARGTTEAPRMVRPPARIDPAILADLVRGNRATLDALEPRLGELEGAAGCIRHQDLGDLTALEWLRFAHVHSLHHLAICRDVRRSLAAARTPAR